MTVSPPTQSTFTPEQRRILGQVYNLILSWRREKRKPGTVAETATPEVAKTAQPADGGDGGDDD